MEEVHFNKYILKPTQSNHKYYAHIKRRDLEFEITEWFSIFVTHEEVMIFCKKGKPNPKYVGPYRIMKRVGNVAYEL